MFKTKSILVGGQNPPDHHPGLFVFSWEGKASQTPLWRLVLSIWSRRPNGTASICGNNLLLQAMKLKNQENSKKKSKTWIFKKSKNMQKTNYFFRKYGPRQKSGGLGGSAPQPKSKNIWKKITVSVLVVFSNQPSTMPQISEAKMDENHIMQNH